MNSIAGNGATEQLVDDQPASELRLRILSAVVLAPISLAAVYAGSPYFEALLVIAAAIMTWEWDRLCSKGRFGSSGYVLALSVLVSIVAAGAGRHGLALVAIFVGACAAYIVARFAARSAPAWNAVGAIAIGLPCAALIWMRFDPQMGLKAVFWLIGAVWVTDISGFVFGRMIGGPKLAPTISPGKTWAGLIGAVVMTAIWTVAWTQWLGIADSWLIIVLIGGAAAVVSQAGDLAVSVVKRRFGAKDASNVIPGHGGVLDRFDGMVAVAPLVSVLALAKTGNIFSW